MPFQGIKVQNYSWGSMLPIPIPGVEHTEQQFYYLSGHGPTCHNMNPVMLAERGRGRWEGAGLNLSQALNPNRAPNSKEGL